MEERELKTRNGLYGFEYREPDKRRGEGKRTAPNIKSL